ncbi:hypothetical protein Plhal304r1_c005g0020561 [Plasmopara halstedii]
MPRSCRYKLAVLVSPQWEGFSFLVDSSRLLDAQRRKLAMRDENDEAAMIKQLQTCEEDFLSYRKSVTGGVDGVAV